TNLSAEQKRAFNEAVQSGDAGRAALAVQGLVALRGGNGRLLNGKTAANADAGPKPFQSQAQVVEAMRDVRYHRDPAYRAEVSARLAVSPLFK
ncbi:capsid assembly protein, partial [Enterobacter hormaechei]